MTWLEMGDSSTPPGKATHLPVYGFYIGGDTPRVWTPAEVFALDCRYALPIWTCNITDQNPAADAADIIAALHALKWSAGTLVALDTETAIIPAYVAELDAHIKTAGFRLLHYMSKGAEASYAETSGGRWIADWTGLPHLAEGSVATQYASAAMTGGIWDQDVIDASAPLHEIHPPAVHAIPDVAVAATLPELSAGDSGPAVRRLQGLLEAWHPQALGPGGIDGKLGPDTAASLALFRRMYGITNGAGAVTAETWERLLTG